MANIISSRLQSTLGLVSLANVLLIYCSIGLTELRKNNLMVPVYVEVLLVEYSGIACTECCVKKDIDLHVK